MTQVDGGGVASGTVLNGIYTIEKRIAMGGMGEVYVARDRTGKKFAIKMILPEHAHNEIILELFEKEAATLHDLYNPAIVRYYVFTTDPVLDRPYLAMEFADGPALNDRLRNQGPLGEHEMTVLRARIADGLHAAHEAGVVHRDISPDNIILVDDDVNKAKIIDFGIAKSTTSEGTLIGSGFAGKLKYVSPEQLGLAGGDVTPKSDIYSLGLVFAEAATGQPLPMDGTQVEVVEKRREVPDLSTVPAYLRPLIEQMLQPDPAMRPADMRAVATWGEGAAPAAGPAAPPRHPRERRRARAAPQVEAREKRRGGGLLWLALGGIGLAAAAAAAYVTVIDPTVLDRLRGGGQVVIPPQVEAELSAPAGPATALSGQVGRPYAWASDPFLFDGDRTTLALSADGGLPPGLSLEGGADGRGRLSGTPTQAGSFQFTMVATTPGGQTARLPVGLSVTAEEASGPPKTGTLPLLPPSGGTPLTGTGPDQTTPPFVPNNPPDNTPLLTPPDDGQIALNNPETPNTGPGTGDGSVEPDVGTKLPGGLRPPDQPGDGAPGVGDDSGSPLLVPQTGGTQQQAPDSSPQIGALPPQQNQPPTLVERPGAALTITQGAETNSRLGKFFDEDGGSALELRVDGRLPNGTELVTSPDGSISLRGAPSDYGRFEVDIAAVDPQGLVSESVPLIIDVARSSANPRVRDYILGYDGGACFLSRPMDLGAQTAQIEVFAAQIPPVVGFDADFKRDIGFEASIGLRLITDAQCALIKALDQVGPQALDNSLRIQLIRDELASGDRLRGKVLGGDGAKLFLFDHAGGITDLSGELTPDRDGVAFAVPLHANGPQILIAARLRDGAPPTSGLEAMLGAAQRGDASLALSFFVIKG